MDDSVLKAAIGDMIILEKGVVMMYRAEKSSWVQPPGGGLGMLVWCTDMSDNSQYFKLLRLGDGREILSEELYEDFEKNYHCKVTSRGTHRFHTMEFENYIAGVCFDDDSNAKEFEAKIPIMSPKSKPGAAPAKSQRKGLFSTEKKEKKKKEALQQTERPEMVISGPTDFKHVAHVGWDEQQGFQVQDLPAEWKVLFKKAGVKKKDLTDKDTARMIVETITEKMSDQEMAQMPALPGVTDRPRPKPPPAPPPRTAPVAAPQPHAQPTPPPRTAPAAPGPTRPAPPPPPPKAQPRPPPTPPAVPSPPPPVPPALPAAARPPAPPAVPTPPAPPPVPPAAPRPTPPVPPAVPSAPPPLPPVAPPAMDHAPPTPPPLAPPPLAPPPLAPPPLAPPPLAPPPLAPAAPPPPAPPPPAAPGAGDARGAMLAAIQGGGTALKKVERTEAPAAPAAGGRDGLLAEISQGGFKLKKAADRQLAQREEPQQSNTGVNDVAAALAERLKERNKKMNQDSDEDSDDDDWDD
ncbi:hypothetical protein AB1Y20_015045 [Prymnesium parvum]|uniref:Non-specific serine/threonine protein kinase n=1 Tax=Prymnesium parvum TaxID=97485 RepID=A0AB34JZL0_PRYPA